MILLKNCWVGVKQQSLTHTLWYFIILLILQLTKYKMKKKKTKKIKKEKPDVENTDSQDKTMVEPEKLIVDIAKNIKVYTNGIQHSKGPGKCVGLYRMSEYSGFI